MSAPPATVPPAVRPRPRRRGIWVLVAAATAVFVVLPGLAAAALFAIRHHQDQTAVWHRPLTLLRVSAPGANVTVFGGQAGLTGVEQHLTWFLGAAPRVRETWSGRTLTVTAPPCARKPPWHCEVGLGIQVPAGVAVQAGAGAGSLNVVGLTGPVHTAVTSGQISLLDLHGPAWATATSGAISAASLACPQVQAAVSSGSLALQFVLPPLRVTATATSGDVSVTVPPGTRYHVTGNSGVSPELASASSPRVITVSSISGSAGVGYDYGQPAPPAPRSPARPRLPRRPASHRPAS